MEVVERDNAKMAAAADGTTSAVRELSPKGLVSEVAVVRERTIESRDGRHTMALEEMPDSTSESVFGRESRCGTEQR